MPATAHPRRLRPHQKEALKALTDAFAAGEERVTVVSACGTGKTLCTTLADTHLRADAQRRAHPRRSRPRQRRALIDLFACEVPRHAPHPYPRRQNGMSHGVACSSAPVPSPELSRVPAQTPDAKSERARAASGAIARNRQPPSASRSSLGYASTRSRTAVPVSVATLRRRC
ncbi:DEAD/DEAH box helicase family protein [Streptomyces scabiei]|uniref:DEAD/DEAH box helicase family protein n=1 Tax=Streptomyces scabiei TaxID=1930 RepID=UPI00131CC1D3